MEQDANKIIDVVGNEWATNQHSTIKKLAVLAEENERLKKEIEKLKKKKELNKAE